LLWGKWPYRVGWTWQSKAGSYPIPLWINSIYDIGIMQNNPKWWNKQNDSSWERVKAAFKRDWDQTKHDVGGHEPDTQQHVGDTVKQAAGKEALPPRGVPNYEETEDAYRFGYGARSQYSNRFTHWDTLLETELERDWRETYKDRDWQRYRESVRRGWDYQGKQGLSKAA
jgi:hypothetical protein